MRIGLVLPATPSYSETFFRSKITGLAQSGHEVVLFVHRSSTRRFLDAQVVHQWPVYRNRILRAVVTVMGISVLLVTRPRRCYRFFFAEVSCGHSTRRILENLYINAHILSRTVDWLHFGFITMGIRRENVGKAMLCPVSASMRGYDIGIYPLKHQGCYNLLWQRLHKVHTISDDMVEVARKMGLPRHMHVQKITPAIQSDKFEVTRRPFFSEGVKILTVARLNWKKGLTYTIDALARLWHDYHVAFEFTIVGAGEESERILFACHQLGVSERVRLVGYVDHSQIPVLMADNDIFIQYSVQEGFSNSVLEAQASGMICVVSDADGLSENVINNITGFVVPKRNPRLLATKLRDICNLPHTELNAISEAAKERVRKSFSLEQQRQAFGEFFK